MAEPTICCLSVPDQCAAANPQVLLSFVVVSVLNLCQQTPILKWTVNPVYNPKDAMFDFLIYLSLTHQLGILELIIWDKDMLRKDYLSQVSLPLKDWFVDRHSGKDREFGFDQPGNNVGCFIL